MPQRFSTDQARKLQRRLINRLIEKDDFLIPPETVCGLDVSYVNQTAIGSAVVLSFPKLEVIENSVISCKILVPYVPTFLSFREYPPLSLAYSSLKTKPDLCFVDAHGKAHPLKMGAASHFGILRNVPTIGVAKRLLCGEIRYPEKSFPLIQLDNEIIGAEIATKPHTKPIYVSVGHRITLERAIKMTRECTTKYRLPEPIRHAHRLATKNRQELLASRRT